MFLFSLSTAPEQHAWCDHLDAAGWEAGGLQSHPCSPNPVLHTQWAGLWSTLWQDTDHLFEGTHLFSKKVTERLEKRMHQFIRFYLNSELMEEGWKILHWIICNLDSRGMCFTSLSTPWTKTRAWRCQFRLESTCGWVCLHMRRSSIPSLREPSVCLLSWYITSKYNINSRAQICFYLSKLNMLSFALQYENQAKVFGKWGTTGLVGRHKFSDVTGKLKLKQEYFLPPRGWEWEADWFIDPEKAWV